MCMYVSIGVDDDDDEGRCGVKQTDSVKTRGSTRVQFDRLTSRLYARSCQMNVRASLQPSGQRSQTHAMCIECH